MDNPVVKITPMVPSDVPGGMRLSTAEGWNQTEDDWQLILRSENAVCVTARDRGRLVGTTTAVNYQERVAWVGMVLVDRECRGRGISKAMLQETFRQLGSCESIKLDATPAGCPVYRKLGFEDEYLIQRMIRTTGDKTPVLPSGITGMEKLTGMNLEEVIDLDAVIFGSRREWLIRDLAERSRDFARVFREENRVTGFVLGRRGSRYLQLGPLVARTETSAVQLFQAAFTQVAPTPLVVDVPGTRENFKIFLESAGFSPLRTFTRMFMEKNPFPGIPGSQYLIAGPEFG